MAVGLFVLILSLKLVMGKQEGFIVGGDYVDSIENFPHVAFLTVQIMNSDDEFICGSSILNQLILISAAHCFDNIRAITASVGHVDREKGKIYKVMSWKQHDRWNADDASDMIHDIALCRLKKSLTFGPKVKRVVLMKDPPKAKIADLAGWGAHEEEDYLDTIQLKHTRQKLWSREKCIKVLRGVPVGTICGSEAKARGEARGFASRGDSGSGLLVNNRIIIGVVSYKYPDISRSLVVYTHVPYYYKWIARTAKLLACAKCPIRNNLY